MCCEGRRRDTSGCRGERSAPPNAGADVLSARPRRVARVLAAAAIPTRHYTCSPSMGVGVRRLLAQKDGNSWTTGNIRRCHAGWCASFGDGAALTPGELVYGRLAVAFGACLHALARRIERLANQRRTYSSNKSSTCSISRASSSQVSTIEAHVRSTRPLNVRLGHVFHMRLGGTFTGSDGTSL